MAGRTVNPFSGLSGFWSLRCYRVADPLASSTATVTLTACQAGLMCFSKAQEAPFFTSATGFIPAALGSKIKDCY